MHFLFEEYLFLELLNNNYEFVRLNYFKENKTKFAKRQKSLTNHFMYYHIRIRPIFSYLTFSFLPTVPRSNQQILLQITREKESERKERAHIILEREEKKLISRDSATYKR